MNDLAVGFLIGCGFTFLAIGAAVLVLNQVDTWWGHRQFRKLENLRAGHLDSAVSEHPIGFRDDGDE